MGKVLSFVTSLTSKFAPYIIGGLLVILVAGFIGHKIIVSGLKAEIAELRKDLSACNEAKATYKSAAEGNAKELERLTTDLAEMDRLNKKARHDATVKEIKMRGQMAKLTKEIENASKAGECPVSDSLRAVFTGLRDSADQSGNSNSDSGSKGKSTQ